MSSTSATRCQQQVEKARHLLRAGHAIQQFTTSKVAERAPLPSLPVWLSYMLREAAVCGRGRLARAFVTIVLASLATATAHALDLEPGLEENIRESSWIVVVEVLNAPKWEGDRLTFKISSSLVGDGEASRVVLFSQRTAMFAPDGGRVRASERAGDLYVYFLRTRKDGTLRAMGRRPLLDGEVREGLASYPVTTYEHGLREIRVAVTASGDLAADAWCSAIGSDNALTSRTLLGQLTLAHWTGPLAIPSLSGLTDSHMSRLATCCAGLLLADDHGRDVDLLRASGALRAYLPNDARQQLTSKARARLWADRRALRCAALGLLAKLGDNAAFDRSVEILKTCKDDVESAEAIYALGALATDREYRERKQVVPLLAERLSDDRLAAALLATLPLFTDGTHRSAEEWRTWWTCRRSDYDAADTEPSKEEKR